MGAIRKKSSALIIPEKYTNQSTANGPIDNESQIGLA